jgi:hypothetical protein
MYVPDALSATGLTLLMTSILLIDKTDHFPGWWAVLPTAGTALILAGGMEAWLNRKWLAHPVLTFYGRISYPLYLWHWPLLVFPALLDRPLETADQIGLLILAVGLAVLTTFGIEKPLREGRGLRVGPLQLMGALAAVGMSGIVLYRADGLVDALPDAVRTIALEQLHQDTSAIRLGRCFQSSTQTMRESVSSCVDRTPPGAPLMVLWGDSFAASLYPGLRSVVQDGTLRVRLAQFTGPLCPPLLTPSNRQLVNCQELNRLALQQMRIDRPDTVVLVASWMTYQPGDDEGDGELQGLQTTIRTLQQMGVPRVVVVGELPVWRTALPRILLAHWRQDGEVPHRLAAGFVPRGVGVDNAVGRIAAASGAEFISPLMLLCNSDGCETTVSRLGVVHPMAHDQAHLGAEGSGRLARLMLPALQKAAGP